MMCVSRLTMDKKQGFFEFSEHSVISNLYWGIDNIEVGKMSKFQEERICRLRNSETMLQVPALLDETGYTAGISNRYLICCSYFYLSVVRNLQGDEWQAAMHFLQSLLVAPNVIKSEFVKELCESLFPSFSSKDCNVVAETARRYKHWLMYYQVMFYGGSPWLHSGNKIEANHFLPDGRADQSSNSLEHQKSGTGVELDVVEEFRDISEIQNLDHISELGPGIKRLHDMLKETQSDTNTIIGSPLHDSEEGSDWEVHVDDIISSITRKMVSDHPQPETYDQLSDVCLKLQALCSTSGRKNFLQREVNELAISFKYEELDMPWKNNIAENNSLMLHEIQLFDPISSAKTRIKRQESEMCLCSGKENNNDLLAVLQRCISSTRFSKEDYAGDIYEMLNNKTEGKKYTMLKDAILDQLLTEISTSREETVIRASVTMLTTIISNNKSAVDDIKKKGLQLSHLASALKQNVHEAATLIYLINPPPSEIKSLELLPALVEVVCKSRSYRGWQSTLLVKPPAASVMIIEVLVTAFDFDTNNSHLAAINSPQVLCGLLDITRHSNLEEFVSLATILVKCMQFDGHCRKYLYQFAPVAPFISLLRSNEKRAKFIALKYLHEILCMPRSSAIKLLQKIQKEGSDIMHVLINCVEQLENDYQLMAADILIQLDILENTNGESMYREEAMQVLFKAVASEENSTMQLLSTFILSNIGGTYSWTGESYTTAWLVKKAGLISRHHLNIIRNLEWMDQSLQDAGIDSWSGKIARSMIDIGKPVFAALEKGLKSKIKRISRDSLIAIAWLSYEIIKSPNSLRDSACELLLDGIEQFLHPGMDLEERLLACLCIYNYASGKGMKKLIHFSEGVRESLRRFSNVTWMAEELHKVADYYLPNKSRISCVHTQILEISHNFSGAVTALIYYKGLLFTGYSNGAIKVWEIKGQSAILVWDMKEHKKTVTCFALYDPGECLLSGSADKTIRVWQMLQRKLECIELIPTKAPIQKLDTYGQMIAVITQSHRLKVIDSSRKMKDLCKSKSVKTMCMVQGRIYAGCTDSSIQEISVTNNREREIRPPTKSWRLQNKPVNSIVQYKEWLYCAANSTVDGSDIKDWRRQCEPLISIITEKGSNVLAMEMVEDFMYLNCSSSTNTLQIWLRNKQQKVGRISAGNKITSLLVANDIVLCGTETGLIKGWIPL
ncbi:hypothetical protein ACFE04_014473 [Oxalis oulophora]